MSTSRGPRATFLVEIQGTDSAHRAFRRPISWHAVQRGAFAAVIEIAKQWAASNGAVQPGSKVSIVDTRDGGTIFFMQYLGYDPNTLFDGRRT